jgi:hypothetical protein
VIGEGTNRLAVSAFLPEEDAQFHVCGECALEETTSIIGCMKGGKRADTESPGDG